jgi:hypothetical protein
MSKDGREKGRENQRVRVTRGSRNLNEKETKGRKPKKTLCPFSCILFTSM